MTTLAHAAAPLETPMHTTLVDVATLAAHLHELLAYLLTILTIVRANLARFEEARARARSMLQKDPSNLEGLILLGNALAGVDFDACRDRAAIAGRPAELPAERWEETDLESGAFNPASGPGYAITDKIYTGI